MEMFRLKRWLFSCPAFNYPVIQQFTWRYRRTTEQVQIVRQCRASELSKSCQSTVKAMMNWSIFVFKSAFSYKHTSEQ